MLSEPEFDVNDTEEIVGAVVSMVTVRPEDVEVTVESLNTVLERAVMTLLPAVSVSVSQVHAPVTSSAVHVLPDATPSTSN